MKSILIHLFLILSLVVPGVLLAQTDPTPIEQRQTIVSRLNTALAEIQGNNSQSETVSLEGIKLKGVEVSCTDWLTSSDVLTLTLDPGDPNISEDDEIVFNIEWKDDSRMMDVPPLSHFLVCDLTNWLFHAGAGGTRVDTNNSRGYEFTCDQTAPVDPAQVDPTLQPYFMIHGSADVFNTNGGYDMPWTGFRTDKFGTVMVDNNETLDSIVGKEFAQVRGCGIFWNAPQYRHTWTKPVWFGKRYIKEITFPGEEEPRDALITELRHAHNVLEFDYRYYDHSVVGENPAMINGCPELPVLDPDIEYIVPVNDPARPNRLDSISVVFMMSAYPTTSQICDPVSDFPVHTVAENMVSVTMTAFYNGGSTWVYTNSYSSPSSITDPFLAANDKNKTLWGWYNGDALFKSIASFDVDEDGFLFFKMKRTDGTIEIFHLIKVRSKKVPAENCVLRFPLKANAVFEADKMTGAIGYRYTDASANTVVDPVYCLDFCDDVHGGLAIENVISASAQTFASSWEYDPEEHGAWRNYTPGGLEGTPNGNPFTGQPDNVYQRGEEGKWRLQRTYAFKGDRKSAAEYGETVYENAGIYADKDGNSDFTLFNWEDEANNSSAKWLNTTTVTQYAPSGEAVEEKNIIDIYSTAKLAHGNTVPLLVAQNARYDNVAFTSFEEKEYSANTNEGATAEFAHSGKTSYKMDNGQLIISGFKVTDQLVRSNTGSRDDQEKGLLVKFWVKRDYSTGSPSSMPPIKITVTPGIVSSPVFQLAPTTADSTFEPQRIFKVAQTGEWSLYQLIIDNFIAPDPNLPAPEFSLTLEKKVSDQIWIDDIRVQPLDAQMTCYVYDRDNLRLLAQFDDQHFGVFYQYNGEGKLVRTRRETERGIKTVAETQYNTPMSPRYSAPETGGGSAISPMASSVPQNFMNGAGRGGASAASSRAELELMNLHIGPEGPSVNFFGNDSLEMPHVEAPGLPALKDQDRMFQQLKEIAPAVPEIKQARAAQRLLEIDGERKDIRRQLRSETGVEIRAGLLRKLELLEVEQETILRKELGLSDEEIEQYKDSLSVEKEYTQEESE